MLYTAQAYVDGQPADRREAAVHQLAPLIRVPFLSQLWQSAPVLSSEPEKLLLQILAPRLKQYMAITWVGPRAGSSSSLAARRTTVLAARHGTALHCTSPACNGGASEEAGQVMSGAECSSWFLDSRQYTGRHGGLNDGVELLWELPVSKLKAASMCACTGKRTVTLESDAVTPPLQGVCWGLRVDCEFGMSGQGAGSKLCVTHMGYSVPRNLPKGIFFMSSHIISISSPARTLNGVRSRLATAGWGWSDFFSLGVMAGGWDEAAWAAKGLPTDGTLQLKLKVEPSS